MSRCSTILIYLEGSRRGGNLGSSQNETLSNHPFLDLGALPPAQPSSSVTALNELWFGSEAWSDTPVPSMLCFCLFVCAAEALYLLPASVTQYHSHFLYHFVPLSSHFISFSLWVWHVCLASGGSDLVLLRMMTLPEGLAGHCLTVIGFLLLSLGEEGMEGWRSKEKREWDKSRRERERLEGKRNHRLLWRPILQASLPRPTLQDILDSSTLPCPPPIQLLSFLQLFFMLPSFLVSNKASL